MALSIWDGVVAIILVSIIIALATPMIAQFGNQQIQNQLTSSNFTSNQFNKTIYQPVIGGAYTNNAFGGVFTPFTNPSLTGLAFIYGAFSNFVNSVAQIGRFFTFIIETTLYLIGVQGVFATQVTQIMNLVGFAVGMRYLLVFISGWMKVDIARL